MITKYHLIELKETVQTETIIKCILIWLLQITFHTVIVISTMQRIIYHHSHKRIWWQVINVFDFMS